MDSKPEYSGFRLRRDTLEHLRDIKLAFESTYARRLTNDDFIHLLTDSVQGGDPAVWEDFCRIRETRSRDIRKQPGGGV